MTAARLLPALILLAVGLASLWPIMSTGDWYVSHQAYRYPYLLEQFRASFLAGHLYPRWLPELYGGYGYPTFVYYPPGFWFIALPFALILPNVVHASYAALIALFWLGGIGAYRLGRLTLGRWAALFCAILFLLSPYLSIQLYTRGSLAELAAMLICPWAFFYLLRVKEALAQRRPALRPALLLAVALAAMVATHLLITLWLGISFFLILAVLLIGRDWPKGFLPVLMISGLLAVALASPYWYPAFAMRHAVTFQRALWAGPPLAFGEFIAVRARMTSLVCSVLALAGLWLGRKQRLTQGVALASLVLLLLMLPTGSAIWQSSRVLQMTQHPGRVFSVFATLELLAFIACVGHLTRQPRLAPRVQAVAALLILAAMWATVRHHYRIQDRLDYAEFRLDVERKFDDMTHTHEFQPRGVRIEGLPPRSSTQLPIAQAGEGAILTIQSSRGDDIRLQAAVAGIPAAVTLNQFSFPGWRLTLDDQPLPRCGEIETACWQPDEHGRMRVLLPSAGTFALRAWFDGPPHWLARSMAASIILALCIALLRRLDTSRASAA